MEVAPGQLRRAVVREHDLPDVLDMLVPPHQPNRRQAKPFLIDLGRVAGQGTRRHAADLGDVADRRRESEQLGLVEDPTYEQMLR